MSNYWYCCECKDGGHGFGTSACTNCYHVKCGGCTTEYSKDTAHDLANISQSISSVAAATIITVNAQDALAHSHPLPHSLVLTHSHPVNTTIVGNLNPYGDEAPTDGSKQYRWICHECGGDNSYEYSKRCTSGDCHHELENCVQCDVYVMED
ncbi:hypothetical protein BDU57DRAFT_547664 [Ampelomyces quisqualis]|uniref:Uncharacterized protein n=1 Tax=Ampelomyces quisqualis TaxID=50730 RepID=A0A6A5QMA7_AMPQU|nr:hypothetical protein BDU57DRAFT_547664 [Ampelomyces quisqualis]